MPEVLRLMMELHTLSQHAQNGWVRWETLALRFRGNVTHGLAEVQGIAELPELNGLIVFDDRVVKITGEGLQWLNENAPNATDGEAGGVDCPTMVANVVRRYAETLQSVSYNVNQASRRGIVRNANTARQKYVHELVIELGDDLVASDTPVIFRGRGNRYIEGKVVSQDAERETVFVALSEEIMPDLDLPGTLQVEKSLLVSQLSDRLENLTDWPPRFRVLNGQDDAPARDLIACKGSEEMADRLARLSTPWTRMLWGPPGAGKTFAVAQFITKLIASNSGARALIVAPSNRAADTVAAELARQLRVLHPEILDQRRVFRYGYARLSEVVDCPELSGPTEQDELAKCVVKASVRIRKAERDKASEKEIAILRTELLSAQETLKDATALHVHNAAVVVTTTTQGYLKSSPVPNESWHTVVIDEVTMVPPAMCLFLSSLATERLLLTGDPQQLGPVFETSNCGQANLPALLNAAVWMGQDIFLKSGLTKRANEQKIEIRTDDARLCRLTAQRRCTTEIWRSVQSLYPEVGQLTDENRCQRFVELPPSAGNAVVVLDMSDTSATCERAGKSWKNEFSAQRAIEVAVTIAAEADDGTSIAIITPYRGQVRLLRKYVKNELAAEPCPLKTNQIRLDVGTVHQFQGSEADVVIFDMVDGAGRATLGALLKGDTGRRLVNVAITRARGKLIVLADRNWCERCQIQNDNPLLGSVILGCTPKRRPRVERPRPLPPLTELQGSPIDSGAPLSHLNLTESPIEDRLRSAMLQVPILAQLAQQQVYIFNETGRIITRTDFAFPALKYAVYCDGRKWHAIEDRWQSDIRIVGDLAEMGWIASRYSGRDINRNVDRCVQQILNTLRNRLPIFKSQLGESWEMTLSEWKQAVAVLKAFDDQDGLTRIGGRGHENAHKHRVRLAQADGKNVSDRVLRDYP